jgi:hypothetical protein
MAKTLLTRDRAWAYVLLNLSIPGWGSLKAGRRIAGFGEIIIVFVGLALLGIWFFIWMGRIAESETDDTMAAVPPAWLWKYGVACIVVSWVWTVATCIGLVRQAYKQDNGVPQDVPPRLSDLPKPPKL